MGLTIRASSFFVKRYLKVTRVGVEFMETAALGGRRKFYFAQINAVLMSQNHVLSFQVGQEVFSIQTKPHKRKHQQVIQQLLSQLTLA